MSAGRPRGILSKVFIGWALLPTAATALGIFALVAGPSSAFLVIAVSVLAVVGWGLLRRVAPYAASFRGFGTKASDLQAELGEAAWLDPALPANENQAAELTRLFHVVSAQRLHPLLRPALIGLQAAATRGDWRALQQAARQVHGPPPSDDSWRTRVVKTRDDHPILARSGAPVAIGPASVRLDVPLDDTLRCGPATVLMFDFRDLQDRGTSRELRSQATEAAARYRPYVELASPQMA